MKKLDPITPGEILLEEFLKPMGLSQYRLAKEIVFLPSVSVRLLVVSVRLQQTRICVCVDSLVYPMVIGYAPRLLMIQKLRSVILVLC